MVLYVEVIFEETLSDQSSTVSLSSWSSYSNRRVRRDVEFQRILEEEARIEAGERNKKKEETKTVVDYTTQYMNKRSVPESTVGRECNRIKWRRISETEMQQAILNGPYVPVVSPVEIVTVRDQADDGISRV